MSIPLPAPEVAASPAVIPPEFLPRYDLLVTEDDTPVDGIYSEKQMRLLTESLYASWAGPGENRPFLALTNVGLFYGDLVPPVVPDMFLSVDVEAPQNLFPKENRSYFLWRYLKSPEVAIEIVSNNEGGEDDKKMGIYATVGIPYYVIWDPQNLLKRGRLRVFELVARHYEPRKDMWFPLLNLALTLWQGQYENVAGEWLRWCDREGNLVLTGHEQRERADNAHEIAEKATQRAERLEAKLRALGLDPNGGEQK
jgi:Uma2 family endonuclease